MNRPTRPLADKASCCREVEPIHAGSPQGLIIVTCVYADDRPDCQRGRRAGARRDRPEQATFEKAKLRPFVPFLRPESAVVQRTHPISSASGNHLAGDSARRVSASASSPATRAILPDLRRGSTTSRKFSSILLQAGTALGRRPARVVPQDPAGVVVRRGPIRRLRRIAPSERGGSGRGPPVARLRARGRSFNRSEDPGRVPG
jgi:hypothetical protein